MQNVKEQANFSCKLKKKIQKKYFNGPSKNKSVELLRKAKFEVPIYVFVFSWMNKPTTLYAFDWKIQGNDYLQFEVS